MLHEEGVIVLLAFGIFVMAWGGFTWVRGRRIAAITMLLLGAIMVFLPLAFVQLGV